MEEQPRTKKAYGKRRTEKKRACRIEKSKQEKRKREDRCYTGRVERNSEVSPIIGQRQSPELSVRCSKDELLDYLMESEDTSTGIDRSVQDFKFIKEKLMPESKTNVKPSRNYPTLKNALKLNRNNHKGMKVKKFNFLELVKCRKEKVIKIISDHKINLMKAHSKIKARPSNTKKS